MIDMSPMKVAFQMESMEDVVKEKSATFLMMAEAQKRGYELYHYTSDTMSTDEDGITAEIAPINIHDNQEQFYTLGQRKRQNLNTVDMIVMRQNPPVDMRYLTLCYMLDTLKSNGVFVTNDPASLIGLPEKMSIFKFPEHIPPTLVTSDKDQALEFFEHHKDIIVKPLYLFFGHGIQRIQNAKELDTLMDDIYEPIMIQKFLPEISDGNKRIILFDGEIIAAIRSTPEDGDFLVYREGEDFAYTPSNNEISLCEKIGKHAQDLGAHFIGVDLIGETLTEINVTSVGSLTRVNKTHNTKSEEKFWDMLEEKYAKFKAS